MKSSLRIAAALKRAFGCDGIHVTQANGASAGQDVFHYHMHLWPRWSNRQEKHRKETRESLAGKIRAALSS